MTTNKTIALLALAMLSGAAHAQTNAETQRAELARAATGESFKIGEQRFRIAPDAVATRPSAGGTTGGGLTVAGYELTLRKAQAGGRAKRSTDGVAAAAGPSQPGELGVAVADGGAPVVLTKRLNLFFSSPSIVADAVRDTGGTLTYSSTVGGHAVVEYGSVDDAIAAMRKIQGMAGVKEVRPEILQFETTVL